MKKDVKKFLHKFRTTGFKNGDLVLVAEVMRVTDINWGRKWADNGMEVVDVHRDCTLCKPGECKHTHIVQTGQYGQYCIMKLK